MKNILDTNTIYEAVYRLCEEANTRLPRKVYEKLKAYEHKNREKILENAHLAAKKCRPLCQDTGQVVVFLDLGQDVELQGEYVENAINKAIEDCYREKYLRKSIVKDALFDRENTNTNTPCVIHTRIVEGSKVQILVALKGGGAENTSQVKMFNPTASHYEIMKFVEKVVTDAGENACPPVALGIGIGGTIEQACLLAKRALYFGDEFELDIDNVFDVKILTGPTHIASMPVCVNTNCHSDRYAKCSISNGEISYNFEEYETPSVKLPSDLREVCTEDIKTLKSLKKGDKFLLSGTIFTARDIAHKKMAEEGAPFDLTNKIIFYAGPCPAAPGEVIGPVGPTTSKRMDSFVGKMCEYGALGAIGKGERNAHEGLYFTLTGGVACLVQKCVKSAKLIAYPELGTEAVYELTVEKLPLEVGS